MSTHSTMITPASMDGGLPLLFPESVAPRLDLKLKRRMQRWGKVLIIFSTAVLLLFAGVMGLLSYMLSYPPVAPLASNPKEAIGLDYIDVEFPSASGRTIVNGWYIPAGGSPGPASSRVHTAALNNGNAAANGSAAAGLSKTIVFSHGYGTNREESWVPMYKLASIVHDMDYNVLLFDYGYASKTHKAPATGGAEESEELLAAVQYAKSQGADEVVVWGFSMGAGTALQTALKTDEIDALILDSLFLTSAETLYHNITNFINLPRYPAIPLLETMMPIWSGTSLSSLPAPEVLQQAYDIPIYIIHGTDDEKASYQTAERIAGEQKNALSRSWIVPGGKHELVFQVHPDEYIARAAAFLDAVGQQHGLQQNQDAPAPAQAVQAAADAGSRDGDAA
ncbi:alpha/beta hydrolase [Paenibacillus protaetiae]|uniref:Alpha/beta fold hydrolase n=1 Tax=Paenibacillus protaetiae TaxID=2509456 RepID=A0A4P6EUY8_9BACL|nr:alpha/beta fold hydrolase [Paenibacillus protaetiae]QAY67080.1 alpha/beta fold hydrolase [Paenibacillus protaetiae]